jgi:DNA-binding transcriptional LysR family regulator
MSNPIDRVFRSNVKLRHLQLLVAIDEFRHIGRAAEFLSVTQPAISKTLAEIEKLFGFALFERSTRGTQPTPFGETVIRFARSVLADYERIRDEISAVAAGSSGRTRVGAMVVATPVLLARAVRQLKDASPQTTVLVEEGDLAHLLPKLRLGELDVVVGRLEPAYAAPDLETEKLYNEPMTVVVRPDHPLARRRSVAWTDLAAIPIVMPPPWASLRVKLDQILLKRGLQQPLDVVETASFLVMLSFVEERGAAGFMARSVSRHFEGEGIVRVLPLRIALPLPPVGLITARNRRVSPSTARLIELLRQVARAF